MGGFELACHPCLRTGVTYVPGLITGFEGSGALDFAPYGIECISPWVLPEGGAEPRGNGA